MARWEGRARNGRAEGKEGGRGGWGGVTASRKIRAWGFPAVRPSLRPERVNDRAAVLGGRRRIMGRIWKAWPQHTLEVKTVCYHGRGTLAKSNSRRALQKGSGPSSPFPFPFVKTPRISCCLTTPVGPSSQPPTVLEPLTSHLLPPLRSWSPFSKSAVPRCSEPPSLGGAALPPLPGELGSETP